MARRPITDHRGQAIRLFGLPGNQPKADTREAIPKAIHRRIERRVGKRVAAAKFGTFIVCVLVCVLILVMLGIALSWAGVPKTTAQLATLVVFLVSAGATYAAEQAVVHRVFTSRIIAAFLDEGRCPLCAYDLVGGRPQADGCTVCPECGAAWRVQSKPVCAE